MQNFIQNVFKDKIYTRNACGDYQNPNNVIQACYGCDSDCEYTCYTMCASECHNNTQDTGGTGAHCKTQCTGTCVSMASIIGGK